MKKVITRLLVGILLLSLPAVSKGQSQVSEVNNFQKDVPVLAFQQPNLTLVHAEDVERDNKGQMYRIGTGVDVNITPQNSGLWSTNANGDKVWRLKVKYPGAQALSFMFSKFYLFGNSRIDVYGTNGKKLHLTYTAKDVLGHGEQNMSLCVGDYMMLELVEPAGTPASIIEMNQIIYNYRGVTHSTEKDFGDSESCEVNVNCSEGNNWQDEKRGVARILVFAGNQAGWCSGSLVNNVRQDCTPYFLTAMHCAEGTTTSNYNNWRFYFNYEASGCTNPGSEGSLASGYITGCVKIAGSEDASNIERSDFLLIHLGTMANASSTITTLKNKNVYWNGWDANNTASANGVGIHHPAGDIKKISTYTSTVQSVSYGGMNANTHWMLTWAVTANGRGVTEGGSSGSPLFNNNGGNSRIVGTLSGGSSACTVNGAGQGTGPTQPDLYGKVAYHWTSSGTTNATRLKPWLDPDNTGVLVLNGSSDPCASTPGAPNANFVANQTNVTPGTTVSFTDQTTGSPTSWSWSVTPATGWAYAGGTSAASQNPQITFNTVGSYTVALTATNANGSDTETKTNYIVVAAASGPCAATSTNCDEYIAQVQLNTINNSTACNNYTDYSSISTTLVKGQQYTINIIPGIVGGQVGGGYTNDQIAAWIDFNGDGDFVDAGEQIGMGVIGSGYNGSFAFTVPAGATTGSVRMRVRIIFPGGSMTTIQPCGTNADGEVEDYRVNLTASVGIDEVTLNTVTLYPNPASDNVTIDFNSTIQQAAIRVMDVTGKEVLTAVNKNVETVTLNIASLSAGIYQIVIDTEQGKVIKRISKQ